MSTTGVRRGEPVTRVLTWEVRPGREQEFADWTHGITRCARRFTGNEGVSWLHPRLQRQAHDGPVGRVTGLPLWAPAVSDWDEGRRCPSLPRAWSACSGTG
ncbi:hypothetical protein ABZT34_34920 [Streptomyces sp. NPDC005329]|uniref:hypothetical protein n=1 Tax=Streptomyces sp. NPDC005329 TaxID=3157034 RepID=UPI0033AF161E